MHQPASVLAAAPLTHYEPRDLRAGNEISVFGNAVLSARIEFPDLRIDYWEFGIVRPPVGIADCDQGGALACRLGAISR